MYHLFETVIRNLSLWAFVAIAAMSVLVCAAVMLAPVVEWIKRRKLEAMIVAPLVVGIILYGGSKGFISYPQTEAGISYLTDAGSYITNDMVHVDFIRNAMVPVSADLQGWAREWNSTNDEEWVQFLDTTFAAFPVPADIPYPAATNFSFMFFTTWTPGPTVQTNGVAHVMWVANPAATNVVYPRATGIYTNSSSRIERKNP